MHSVPEYNLRDLGPWDIEGMDLWSTNVPLNPMLFIWWVPSTGQYLGGPNNQPIYFAGTDPRQPGFPPPEDENDVGTPRDQWELAHGPLDLYDLLGPNHF